MSTYFIGDIHGCYNQFRSLLAKVSFNVNHDYLWITGDLVSKGPKSLEVIQYVISLGNRARIVLGNHDLNLIKVYYGIKKDKKENFFSKILKHKDVHNLIVWLKKQPFLQIDENKKIIMTHAGITPQWNIQTAKSCAFRLNQTLSGKNFFDFLSSVPVESSDYWTSTLSNFDLLHYTVNTLTRMRYCFPNKSLDFFYKSYPLPFVHALKPWFMLKSLVVSQSYSIVFGHWAALKGRYISNKIIALDTGCCWGKQLSLFRWEDKAYFAQNYFDY